MKAVRIFGMLLLLVGMFATAAFGGAAPASPAVEGALAAPIAQSAEMPDHLEFTFIDANKSQEMEGTTLIMSGRGTFDPNNIEDATGSGVYYQYDDASSDTPKPITGIGVGRWRVKKGLEFTAEGSYAAATSGVLDLLVELQPVDGDPFEATLRVVCNVPPASLLTGFPEGIVLTIPDVDTFTPIVSDTPGVPPFGITLIGQVSSDETEAAMDTATAAAQMYAAADRIEYTFIVLNKSEAMEGNQLIMSGRGSIDPYNIEDATGSGVYYQYDDASSDMPKPITGIGVGTWRVKKGVAFSMLGDYAAATPGVIDLEIELQPVDGDPIDATLRVVCNVPPASLFTGSPEGIVLTVGDSDTFTPIVSDTPGVPPFGITLIGWMSEAQPVLKDAFGVMRFDVAADLDTFDAVRETAEGDVSPTGPFYVEGSIYPDGTLDADGMAPDDAEPIGTFRCWGWQYDGSADGDAVVHQIYELDDLGEIHLQGRDYQTKAIVGGTGIFRHAHGVALRRDINLDNVTFHAVFDFR